MSMIAVASHFLTGLGIAAIAALLYGGLLQRPASAAQKRILMATLFSAASVAPMFLSATAAAGLPFGVGNVFVVLAMAYGGWWTAISTILVAAAGRFWLGDASGLLGVVLCAIIGFVFARVAKGRAISLGMLVVAGLLSTVALMVILLLPLQTTLNAARAVMLPATLAVAVCTVLVGQMLEVQRTRFRTRETRASEAATDPLTGLLNRRVFDKLGPELAEAMNWAGQPYSMAVIDIDAFDSLLDSHGRTVGEQALRHVAAVVQANVRQTDMVASFGGQAIALVLPAYDAERAFGLAERVQRAVAEAPFSIDGTTLPLTVSVGLHTPLPRKEGFWTALGQADTALNQARAAGRNRVEVAI
ncbi:GGDEF domain-containing protein [Nitratireductor soli]|uniref:GGDEF domain-containing protein n=1 Tax=Nitratireductor soli TaxID=1670619 RepID=UPI00065DD18F|nr:diguanylate cyclase [Nitratireductor soli]